MKEKPLYHPKNRATTNDYIFLGNIGDKSFYADFVLIKNGYYFIDRFSKVGSGHCCISDFGKGYSSNYEEIVYNKLYEQAHQVAQKYLLLI